MNWISVNDRLPEITIEEKFDICESIPVVARTKSDQVYKMRLSHWFEDEPDYFYWVYDDSDEPCAEPITHWMPYEPPKD